jgi:hypothetical protein
MKASEIRRYYLTITSYHRLLAETTGIYFLMGSSRSKCWWGWFLLKHLALWLSDRCTLPVSSLPLRSLILVSLLCFVLLLFWFELRALYLLGKCSTSWAMPPAPFCFSYFPDSISRFCPEPASDHNFYLWLPVARIIEHITTPGLLVEIRSC